MYVRGLYSPQLFEMAYCVGVGQRGGSKVKHMGSVVDIRFLKKNI